MNCIRSKADAQAVVNHIVSTADPITIWEVPGSIRVIVKISDVDNGYGYYVTYHEDTTGEDWSQFHYPAEVTEAIWRNRKYINSSGQLDNI